jgi:hypothetical protein
VVDGRSHSKETYLATKPNIADYVTLLCLGGMTRCFTCNLVLTTAKLVAFGLEVGQRGHMLAVVMARRRTPRGREHVVLEEGFQEEDLKATAR